MVQHPVSKGPKYPNMGCLGVMVLGSYLSFGYLDPEGSLFSNHQVYSSPVATAVYALAPCPQDDMTALSKS